MRNYIKQSPSKKAIPIVANIKKMSQFSRSLHRKGKTIGFVPTMGYLHEGHLSLARQARRDTDAVIMSIFVNPAQFGPEEDFKKYPRDLKRDIALAKKAGVDIIFYPSAHDMYPKEYKTYVDVEKLGGILCGKSRPGHFRGVLTVVVKLFNIVQPDIAYFGQKDAQQALIIKKMAEDLNMPLKIRVMPIIRQKDGLAMSSRNAYLSAEEKQDALLLHQALLLARGLVKRGKRSSSYVIKSIRTMIRKKKNASIDYIEIVNAENLEPVKFMKGKVLIALAVWIGKTRLIDNIVVNI
jgi:pantoate--beta-alanine ligase